MSVTETEKLFNPDPELQAVAIAERLRVISKFEAHFSHRLELRTTPVSQIILEKHELLKLGQRSLVTELCNMGYVDLAYWAVDLGVSQVKTQD